MTVSCVATLVKRIACATDIFFYGATSLRSAVRNGSALSEVAFQRPNTFGATTQGYIRSARFTLVKAREKNFRSLF